jgi:hypothetical protein
VVTHLEQGHGAADRQIGRLDGGQSARPRRLCSVTVAAYAMRVSHRLTFSTWRVLDLASNRVPWQIS